METQAAAKSKEVECGLQMEVDEAGDSTTDSQAEDDESLCYCGKDRDLTTAELLCGLCLKYYHLNCVTIYTGKCLPFMTNYQFFCKRCNPNGLESFNKKQATFKEICHTSLANLMLENDGKTYFYKEKEIIPYIDKHWEHLTTMPRRIKLTWHTTVVKTMMKEAETFIYKEPEAGGDQLFGLANSDLSLVGPNYENLFKNATAGMFNTKDYRMGTGIGESKTRGAKRKNPKEDQPWLPGGSKQKRGKHGLCGKLAQDPRTIDEAAASKVSQFGYPIEHPYNKDGYRYILAESDPHAPNRQKYDESLEWAGKPIPGYLYRTWLGQDVLLALHDRAPQMKVKEDRVTVSGEKGYSMVRATHGVNYGAWYFEVTICEMPDGSATRLGWSQSLGNLQAPCGYDKFSYSWRSRKGTRFHQSRGKQYSNGYKERDVLGFYIYLPPPKQQRLAKILPVCAKDMPLVKFKSHLYFEEKDYVQETEKALKPLKGSLTQMYKNGKNQGQAWTDLYEGTYYPAVSIYKNASVKVNFGPKFRFPPKDMDIPYRPMSDAVEDAQVQHTLSDMLYHIEHEGKLPDF